MCDITCERETICQSYSDVIGEKSCELNTRTKEARPENFQPDDLRFYMGSVCGRSMYIYQCGLVYFTYKSFSASILVKNPPLSESKCLIALLLNGSSVLKQNSPSILHQYQLNFTALC